jgi:hypothetical protein
MPAPDARHLARLQQDWTGRWHGPAAADAPPADEVAALVRENHRRNFDLWHVEDEARRDDLGAEHVRRAKRAIDRLNQERNNFIERLDAALLARLPANPAAPPHTETPGMVLDRLSILALKVHHMREQAERADADAAHRERCAGRLAVLEGQRADLTAALAAFLAEIAAGTRGFKVYYQMKMYNDPALNPQLYRAAAPP